MNTSDQNIGGAAMILAAGLGTRMRPLTDTCPKPLIEVNGRSLIDRSIDRIRDAGIKQVVVNMHYLPEQIEAWAGRQDNPPIILSDERSTLLDTGGGVARALSELDGGPFFVFNSDSFWVDGSKPALERMRSAWSDDDMDCMLLLADPARSIGFDAGPDFSLDNDSRLERFGGDGHGYIYCGCYLVSPRLFASAPGGAFSMNILWNKALAEGRLFGLVHDGLWLHVGTPEAIKEAEDALDGHP